MTRIEVNDSVLGPVSQEELRLLMFLDQKEADELERKIIARNRRGSSVSDEVTT